MGMSKRAWVVVFFAGLAGCGPSRRGVGDIDAGDGPDGGVDGPIGFADGGADGAVGLCSDAGRALATQWAPPTFHLLLDRSGSMSDSIGGATRWTALRDAVTSQVAPKGIVVEYGARIPFGSTIFWGLMAEPACPGLVTRTAALSAAPSIAQDMGKGPVSSARSPVGEAIRKIQLTFPPAGSRGVILVVTDGEPNLCSDLQAVDRTAANADAIAAAAASFSKGTNVRLVAINIGLTVNKAFDNFAQAFANAGVGASTNVTFGRANTETEMRPAILDAVRQEACTVRVVGLAPAVAMACQLTVKIGDTVVPCKDADGWSHQNGEQIRFNGASCDPLLAGGTVSVSAPCN